MCMLARITMYAYIDKIKACVKIINIHVYAYNTHLLDDYIATHIDVGDKYLQMTVK